MRSRDPFAWIPRAERWAYQDVHRFFSDVDAQLGESDGSIPENEKQPILRHLLGMIGSSPYAEQSGNINLSAEHGHILLDYLTFAQHGISRADLAQAMCEASLKASGYSQGMPMTYYKDFPKETPDFTTRLNATLRGDSHEHPISQAWSVMIVFRRNIPYFIRLLDENADLLLGFFKRQFDVRMGQAHVRGSLLNSFESLRYAEAYLNSRGRFDVAREFKGVRLTCERQLAECDEAFLSAGEPADDARATACLIQSLVALSPLDVPTQQAFWQRFQRRLDGTTWRSLEVGHTRRVQGMSLPSLLAAHVERVLLETSTEKFQHPWAILNGLLSDFVVRVPHLSREARTEFYAAYFPKLRSQLSSERPEEKGKESSDALTAIWLLAELPREDKDVDRFLGQIDSPMAVVVRACRGRPHDFDLAARLGELCLFEDEDGRKSVDVALAISVLSGMLAGSRSGKSMAVRDFALDCLAHAEDQDVPNLLRLIQFVRRSDLGAGRADVASRLKGQNREFVLLAWDRLERGSELLPESITLRPCGVEESLRALHIPADLAEHTRRLVGGLFALPLPGAAEWSTLSERWSGFTKRELPFAESSMNRARKRGRLDAEQGAFLEAVLGRVERVADGMRIAVEQGVGGIDLERLPGGLPNALDQLRALVEEWGGLCLVPEAATPTRREFAQFTELLADLAPNEDIAADFSKRRSDAFALPEGESERPPDPELDVKNMVETPPKVATPAARSSETPVLHLSETPRGAARFLATIVGIDPGSTGWSRDADVLNGVISPSSRGTSGGSITSTSSGTSTTSGTHGAKPQTIEVAFERPSENEFVLPAPIGSRVTSPVPTISSCPVIASASSLPSEDPLFHFWFSMGTESPKSLELGRPEFIRRLASVLDQGTYRRLVHSGDIPIPDNARVVVASLERELSDGLSVAALLERIRLLATDQKNDLAAKILRRMGIPAVMIQGYQADGREVKPSNFRSWVGIISPGDGDGCAAMTNVDFDEPYAGSNDVLEEVSEVSAGASGETEGGSRLLLERLPAQVQHRFFPTVVGVNRTGSRFVQSEAFLGWHRKEAAPTSDHETGEGDAVRVTLLPASDREHYRLAAPIGGTLDLDDGRSVSWPVDLSDLKQGTELRGILTLPKLVGVVPSMTREEFLRIVRQDLGVVLTKELTRPELSLVLPEELSGMIQDLERGLAHEALPVSEAIDRVLRFIGARYAYDPKFPDREDLSGPIFSGSDGGVRHYEAIHRDPPPGKLGSGVCEQFADLSTECLRRLGIPAFMQAGVYVFEKEVDLGLGHAWAGVIAPVKGSDGKTTCVPVHLDATPANAAGRASPAEAFAEQSGEQSGQQSAERSAARVDVAAEETSEGMGDDANHRGAGLAESATADGVEGAWVKCFDDPTDGDFRIAESFLRLLTSTGAYRKLNRSEAGSEIHRAMAKRPPSDRGPTSVADLRDLWWLRNARADALGIQKEDVDILIDAAHLTHAQGWIVRRILFQPSGPGPGPVSSRIPGDDEVEASGLQNFWIHRGCAPT